ncbi:MAG: hypothetical protein HYX60_03550 [Legionella longbeachae]|nr:hypothetical protein [Legionella longbeachae]
MQNNSKLQEGLFNLLSNEFFFKKSMCIVKSHNEISSGGKIDFGFKHLNELNQINMLQKHEKLLKEMIEKDSNVLFDLFIQFNKNSSNLLKVLGTEFIVNTLTKNLNEDNLLDKFPILLSEIKMENKYTKQNLPIPLFFTDFFSDVQKIILTELLKKDKTTVFTFIDNLYHLLLNTMRYNDSSKLLNELIKIFNLPIEMVISYMNENPKVALAIVQDSDVLQRYLSNDSLDEKTILNLCQLTLDNNIRMPFNLFLQYYQLSNANNTPIQLSSLRKELISYNSNYYDNLLSLNNEQFKDIIPFVFNLPEFNINSKQTGNGKIIEQAFDKWKDKECKYDSENTLVDKVNNKFGPFSNDDLLKLYYNNPEQINKFKRVGLAKPQLDNPSERLSQINSKIINYLLLMDKNIDKLSEQFTEEEKESFSTKINLLKNIPNEVMPDRLFHGLTMFVFELKNQSNPKSLSNELYTKLIQYLKKEYTPEISNSILMLQNYVHEAQLTLITSIINEVLNKEKYSPRFQFGSLNSEINKYSDTFDEYENILQKPIEQPKIPF